MAEDLGGATGRQLAREFAPSFTPALGAYLVILCALYFAMRAVKGKAR